MTLCTLCTHCHSVFRFQTILLCVLYLSMIVFVLPEINTLKNISFACSINGRLSSVALGELNNGNENNTLPWLVHLCHFLFWLGCWVLSTTPKKLIHVKTLHSWKFGWKCENPTFFPSVYRHCNENMVNFTDAHICSVIAIQWNWSIVSWWAQQQELLSECWVSHHLTAPRATKEINFSTYIPCFFKGQSSVVGKKKVNWNHIDFFRPLLFKLYLLAAEIKAEML